LPPNHRRERSLTALVVLEALGLFVLAPLEAKIHVPILVGVVLAAAVIGCVLAVVWSSRAAVAAVLAATLLEAVALAVRTTRPNARTELLDASAALIFFAALTIVLGIAVFGPGRVTIHRILGAIAIYLNVAAVFALTYRVIEGFAPGAFGPPAFAAQHHVIPALIYFSFTTLTTSSFGDVIPIDPLARSAVNLEAVIGQLFPATILARLITLELEARRTGTG
jgi:hypothetical protein